MTRIQSRFWGGIIIFLQIISLSFITNSLFAQSGLQYTPEEIAIWRQRAGLMSGQTMYKSRGDVSNNSPGDWDRIYADALTAVQNSANDRYDNYDTSQGLNGPITELNSPWIPDKSWPARTPYLDDKEPRPGINGNDYAALSIMNAGFVYLLTNDKKFAEPVKKELLWYANNEWLDFSNTRRWVRGKGSFADRNPGFFIACWLNSLVNAYDYTKHAGIYTASEREVIERWFHGALDFLRYNLESDMSNVFNGYRNYDYSQPCTGGWCDSKRGKPFEQSSYMSYGINEYFANRRAVIVRFIMRSSLLLLDKYPQLAEKGVESAHRWIKEWIVYGNFSDGTYTDFHRGGGKNPEQGLQYTTIGLGGLIDAVDSYERKYAGRPGFQSLYDWKLEKGTADYAMYFPSSVKSRPWFPHFEVTQPRGLKLILETTLKHFDRSFGNSRSWSGQLIDGWEPNTRHYIKIVESERMVSVANMYYKDTNFASIYTRTKSGTRGYVSNPSRLGSYDINYGTWGGYPGILFMHGQLEGKIDPYNRLVARAEPTKILDVTSGADFGQVKINTTKSQVITIANSGNTTLKVEGITSNNPLFAASFSGEIAPYSSVDVKVSFTPLAEGEQKAVLTVNSDMTSGDNTVQITGLGVLEITQPEVTTIEAEASGFTVMADVGSNGQVQTTQSTSSFLSSDKAVKLYDVGDRVRYSFEISENAEYQINVRLRSGNAASPTAYWPNGYSFTLNGTALSMQGDVETVSNKDAAFGTSYWGTMKSEIQALDAGTYTLDIEASITWALVDYIEIIKKSSQVVQTRVLDVQDSVVFNEVQVGEVVEQEISLANNGNAPLTITSSKTNNASFHCDFAGTIEPGKTASALIVYSPVEIGDHTAQVEFISDKTEGESILQAIGKCGHKPKFHTSIIEAEKAFEVALEIGSKGFVEVGADNSDLLSGNLAVQLFDIDDAMRIPFTVPYDGKFTLKVRLRVGDRSSPTAYLPDGYALNVNNSGTGFMIENGSVSQQDNSYGISYWGTLQASGLDLKKGENFLNIIAKRNWAAVDYIELIGEEELKPEILIVKSLDFGDVEKGTTAVNDLVLKNIGNDTLNITKTEITGAFKGGWIGSILPGEQQTVTIQFTPEAEINYNANFNIYTEGISKQTIALTGAGVRPAPVSLFIEAEDHFQAVNDVSTKGDVKVASESTEILSNGKAVQIYDEGDRIRIPFEVSKSSLFQIKIRLRAGNHVNATAYLPEGYTYFLNGQKQTYTVEDGSVTALDASFGRSTWGTVVSSPIILEEGQHLLEIEANLSWGLVDYIEVMEVESPSNRQLDYGDKLYTGEAFNEISISAYPNPVTDHLKVSIQSAVHQEGQVTILNTFGKVVYQDQIDNYNNEKNIDATNFSRGFYLVMIDINGETTTKRIMVE